MQSADSRTSLPHPLALARTLGNLNLGIIALALGAGCGSAPPSEHAQ